MSESVQASAEIFNQAFYEPEKGYLGLWKPDPMVEDSIKKHTRELHERINIWLQNQRGRVESPLPAPNLYFDLIKSKFVNAAAKEVSGLYLLGITSAFLTTANEVILELLSRDSVKSFLLIQSESSYDDLNKVQDIFFNTMFLFVINHELGHIVYGHVTNESEEWNQMRNNSLARHVAEIEADAWSSFTTLDGLFAESSSDREEFKLTRLRVFLLAAFGFLESGAADSWDWNSLHTSSHPHYLSRVDFILGATRSWCEKHFPNAAHTLSHDIIINGLEAIQSCWPQKDSLPIDAQADHLLAGAYTEWEAQICEVRVSLRDLLAPFAWRFFGQSDTH